MIVKSDWEGRKDETFAYFGGQRPHRRLSVQTILGGRLHRIWNKQDAGALLPATGNAVLLEKGEEALQSVLDAAKPEVVISCLRGDFAQQLEVHRFLADYLRERPGTRLVYLSTANVFDALNETPHIETDPPQAQSEYGCFKIACEQMLTERLGEQLLILRLPIVWGKNCPRLQILK